MNEIVAEQQKLMRKSEVLCEDSLLKKLEENMRGFFSLLKGSDEEKKFCLEVFKPAVRNLLDEGFVVYCSNSMHDSFSFVVEEKEKPVMKLFYSSAMARRILCQTPEDLVYEWKSCITKADILVLYLPIVPVQMMLPFSSFVGSPSGFCSVYSVIKDIALFNSSFENFDTEIDIS